MRPVRDKAVPRLSMSRKAVLNEGAWKALRLHMDPSVIPESSLYVQSPASAFAEVAVALRTLNEHLRAAGRGTRPIFTESELLHVVRPVTRRTLEAVYSGAPPGDDDPQYDEALLFLAMPLDQVEEHYTAPRSKAEDAYLVEAARCIFAMRLATRVHATRYHNGMAQDKGEALLYHLHASLQGASESSVVGGDEDRAPTKAEYTLPTPFLYGGGCGVELLGLVHDPALSVLADEAGIANSVPSSGWLRSALLDFNTRTRLRPRALQRRTEMQKVLDDSFLAAWARRSAAFERISGVWGWQKMAVDVQEAYAAPWYIRHGALNAPHNASRDPHRLAEVDPELVLAHDTAGAVHLDAGEQGNEGAQNVTSVAAPPEIEPAVTAQYDHLERLNREIWRERDMPPMRYDAWHTAAEMHVTGETLRMPQVRGTDSKRLRDAPSNPLNAWKDQYERIAQVVPPPKTSSAFHAPRAHSRG
ncbi:ORF121 [Ranid herpesvirus 1]|uniref:ORF121 n=1 Tax=Ranid herpesvirus 1 TaxID=85655 RepID=Q14VK9_9VIRU|nr:ORF121 [Ranid herpesvirus 1]ABG25731.1 ORF121 [Ranid herpesvirus 1]